MKKSLPSKPQTKDINDLARKVLNSYLSTSRKPGDLFWSVREIARRFKCTEYLALETLRKLSVERFIERRPGKGSFLREHVDLNLLALAVTRRHVGFVLPYWGGGSGSNLWTDFHQHMAAETHRLGWDATFFGESAEWGDIGFTMKIKLAGCNVIVAVDPGEASLITFTELRREGIPVLVIGVPRKGYEKLGVITLDGDEREAMRIVTLQLLKHGYRKILVAGNSGRFSVQQRYEGCRAAFQELKRVDPGDIFLEEPSALDQMVNSIRSRFKSGSSPDAVVINESALLRRVLLEVPEVPKKARQGMPIVAFDDLYIHQEQVDIPVTSVNIPVKPLVKEAIRIVEQLINGQAVKLRVLIPRIIHWRGRLQVNDQPRDGKVNAL